MCLSATRMSSVNSKEYDFGVAPLDSSPAFGLLLPAGVPWSRIVRQCFSSLARGVSERRRTTVSDYIEREVDLAQVPHVTQTHPASLHRRRHSAIGLTWCSRVQGVLV